MKYTLFISFIAVACVAEFDSFPAAGETQTAQSVENNIQENTSNVCDDTGIHLTTIPINDSISDIKNKKRSLQ